MTPEVKKTVEEMKSKAKCADNLTSDVMILRGEKSATQITTTILIISLRRKKVLIEWKEATMIILYKMET